MSDSDVHNVEDIERIAKENGIQIFIWDMARNHQIPKLITNSNISNPTSNLHICAPYCNEPNDFSLEDLHIIRDIEEYKKKVTNTTTGNIFQALELSDAVVCQSWQQLMDVWGSAEIGLTKERKFRSKFNIGFEIFRVERKSDRSLSFKRLYKSVNDENCMSLEFVGTEWSWNKSNITLDDQFVLRDKECSIYKLFANMFCLS